MHELSPEVISVKAVGCARKSQSKGNNENQKYQIEYQIAVHLIDQGVNKAKRGLPNTQAVRIPTSDDSSPHRGGGRGTVNKNIAAEVCDQIVVTNTSNIRETTVGGIVVLGGRKLTIGVQIVGDIIVLVRRTRKKSGETTARSDQRIRVGANNLSGAGRAVSGLAKWRLEVVGIIRQRIGEGGGTNRKHPRASARENGGKRSSLVVTFSIVITRSALSENLSIRKILETIQNRIPNLISRGRQNRGTTHGDLHVLVVDVVHVLLGGHAVAVTNITLVGLIPSPAHGDNKGNWSGRQEVSGPIVQPSGGGPVPSVGVKSNTDSVLNIKGGLSIGVLGIVRSDNVRWGDRGNKSTSLEGRQVVSGVAAIVFVLNQADRVVGPNDLVGGGNAIQIPKDLRDNLAIIQ